MKRKRLAIGVGLLCLMGFGFLLMMRWHQSSSPLPVPQHHRATAVKSIVIDYPLDGSVFPPEFPAPQWIWRDNAQEASMWTITVAFADGTATMQFLSKGEPLQIGELDPRASSSANKPPSLSKEQAAAHTWSPDPATWAIIKAHSVGQPATVTVTGHFTDDTTTVLSRSKMSLHTSPDAVGAPVFYRDVPLMPSEVEKGVIKPLAPSAVPLISWRLRNIADTQSKVLMEGLHTCANCHSFSMDGKTLGMDMDGPLNDKGLYAIADISPHMTIANENLVEWSTFEGKLGSKLRVGFMSQISPNAQYVITTVNDPGIDQTSYQRRKNPVDLIRNYYVANFKDYRFLQVFFTTRGMLAWYSRESGVLKFLPGADNPEYVHTNAVWSPDGQTLVFARATAKDAYPKDAKLATYAGDPNELPMKYDLFRIPFNDGNGGAAEPIAGASQNGWSNSFPKISPDGRWIVYVQSKNGLLMRPDSQLYIVPFEGGVPRKMTCNTSLMNSWHSFSPNGKWMVFSSKSRSPYTQMFLTHIDENGNDSPAILIDNATAANRAVNLPEFVNIAPDGMQKIDTPASQYALHMDKAVEMMKKGAYNEAISQWQRALALAPGEWQAHNSLGVALMETGQTDEAIAQYQEALRINPEYPEACNNLAEAFTKKGATQDAITLFQKAVMLDPEYLVAHTNLGTLLARTGNSEEAIAHFKKGIEIAPESPDAHRNLGHALASNGQLNDARAQLLDAIRLSDGRDALSLHLLARVFKDMGNSKEAIITNQQALQVATEQNNSPLIQTISRHQSTLLSTPN